MQRRVEHQNVINYSFTALEEKIFHTLDRCVFLE